ncbi:MAG TPA: aldehyde dehydrogenase family protein [Bryobacteraceae bacterium]|nr:aldehyde dehydrogenase family protein [Bryobacteraceae bacterium]
MTDHPADYPMWIGGEAVRTANPQSIRVPFDNSIAGTIYQASSEHVEAAIEAARKTCSAMRATSRHERATILSKAQAILTARREEMARIIASESGKPIREARTEVDRGIFTLLFSAEEAHRLHGEEVPMDAHPGGKGKTGITIREPLGVIAAITPFNFPLNLSLHKIAPAIAAGNTVVHKPASATPISALLLAQIFHEAGLPAGALNVVTGPGAVIGDALIFDPRIAMITFTGSPDVGQRIRNLAGMKRVTLELGSNSAVIVEPDADLDKAIPRCVAGAFAHSGQVSISIQRIYVHEAIHDEFAARLAEAASRLRIGHPQEETTEVSSLIAESEAQRVECWIGEARDAGAKIVTGGRRRGATLEPAVLTGVPGDAKLSAKEAFGPVVIVNSYKTLDDAVAMVNASDYGLQAGMYTRDIDKAFRTARQVHVGGFHINEIPAFRVDQMPYGGVRLSGSGREGPRYAVEEMTELKLITW